MYRIGKALVGLCYYLKAREWFTKSLEHCPDEKYKNTVRSELEKTPQTVYIFLELIWFTINNLNF